MNRLYPGDLAVQGDRFYFYHMRQREARQSNDYNYVAAGYPGTPIFVVAVGTDVVPGMRGIKTFIITENYIGDAYADEVAEPETGYAELGNDD